MRTTSLGETKYGKNADILWKKNPELIEYWDKLGNRFKSVGYYDKAREYFKLSHNLSREMFGENNPETIRLQENLDVLLKRFEEG